MGNRSGLVGLAVLALPIVEIVSFVVLGGALGILRTIALVALSCLVGAWLFRLRVTQLASSGISAKGGLAIFGAVLMLIPGFVTSLVGLILQVPPVRSALGAKVSSNFTTTVTGVGSRFGVRSDVIDVDGFETPGPENNSPSNPSSPELT